MNEPLTQMETHEVPIPVPNVHFNVLAIVRESIELFEKAYPGQQPKWLYAPMAFLGLVTRALLANALHGAVDPEAAYKAFEAECKDGIKVFGLQMVIVDGSCITVTAESLLNKTEPGSDPEVLPFDVLDTYVPTGKAN